MAGSSNRTRPSRSARRSESLNKETRTILLVENGANLNLERASRNLDGVTLVPATGLETYDLMRHDHLMLSREAAAKLSRALSATKPEAPVQIEPAPRGCGKESVEREGRGKSASESRCAERRRRSRRRRKEKPKAKPKGEEGLSDGDEALSSDPAADHHGKGSRP